MVVVAVWHIRGQKVNSGFVFGGGGGGCGGGDGGVWDGRGGVVTVPVLS